MLVRDVMSAPVETVDADASCAEVVAYFRERGLRRAPVLRHGRLAGMVSMGDLLLVAPRTVADLEQGQDHRSYHMPVGKLMTGKLQVVGQNAHVELAARTMLRAKVGALPVVEHQPDGPPQGVLVGILTESDIFKLFVRRALIQRGHRLVLRAPHKPLKELDPASICVDAGAHLFDLGLFPLEGGRVSAVMKLRTDDIDGLLKSFRDAGYQAVLVERD